MNLDAVLFPVLIEDAAHHLDHLLVARMLLAVDDNFVLDLFAARDVREMLVSQAVVPAAVPRGPSYSTPFQIGMDFRWLTDSFGERSCCKKMII